MLIREPLLQEKAKFDSVATHPLQTWAWGDFRRATGTDLLRLALFDGPNILQSFQITIHQIPRLGWKLGYLPKAGFPDDAQLFALKTAAEKHNLIYIKNEPNLYSPVDSPSADIKAARQFLQEHNHVAGRPMFTPFSFILDLTPGEDALFANLKSKTRYNIRLAQKKGVTVVEDNSETGFNQYLDLWRQTTSRQEFYSHSEKYHRLMWQHLHSAGMAHLLKAVYQDQTLGAWILFRHNHTLYYPYGASSRQHRDVMANNLLAWEAIRFGLSKGCTLFDFWGSLGPHPDASDPWYGFHRFKEGYGGTLMEFVGTYDYVWQPSRYNLFTKLDRLRWKYLRFRSRFPL